MSQNWDGKERRSLNQDQIERDRLLTEVHTNMKHMVQWTQDHDSKDDERFERVNKKTDWLTRIACIGIGGLMFFEFILKFVKIGG